MLANARALPEVTLAKIDAYMKQGGMIVFDTKDYGQGIPTGLSMRGEGGTPLQRLLGNLDIPRLEPVPEHHVLTKSFYLLRRFPGAGTAASCGLRSGRRATLQAKTWPGCMLGTSLRATLVIDQCAGASITRPARGISDLRAHG